MNNWKTLIVDDSEHEFLFSELYRHEKFLLQLDREDGRENICISFPEQDGSVSHRVPLAEFIEELQKAAEDLKR
jgi:hypothetical protein